MRSLKDKGKKDIDEKEVALGYEEEDSDCTSLLVNEGGIL